MEEIKSILQAVLENQEITNAKLDALYTRVDTMEVRLDGRIDSLEGRITSLDSRMDSLENRLDRVHHSLQLQIDEVALDVKHIKRGMRMLETDLVSTIDRVRQIEDQRSIG
ncbi:hypothetical protein [Paenibacillus silviterrae]|uniref:hypothetical protein n=1 Tax=Paenibacillus silviterrae TaxID=3242194 RepID=UPI002542EF24|nr:hypothetical protein [Paenibacillus chinjuensis]